MSLITLKMYTDGQGGGWQAGYAGCYGRGPTKEAALTDLLRILANLGIEPPDIENERETMPPMTHISVPYPTVEQGFDSIQHLARAVLAGGSEGRNELLAHGWIVAGTAAGQAFPLAGPMGGVDPVPCAFSPEEHAHLRALAGMKADQVSAVDWQVVLRFILPFVLKLLGCLVLLLVCSAATHAGTLAQAPAPPQAPAATGCTCSPDCDCGGRCGCATGECSGQCGCDPYAEAYRLAVRQGRPLVVWVNRACPSCEADATVNAVHVHLVAFQGDEAQRVIVAAPNGRGGLSRLATLTGALSSGRITTALAPRAAGSGPHTAPGYAGVFAPPASFAGGGCAGGNCASCSGGGRRR